MENTHIDSPCKVCGSKSGLNLAKIKPPIPKGLKIFYAMCGSCLSNTPCESTPEEVRARQLADTDHPAGSCVHCGGTYIIQTRTRHDAMVKAQKMSRPCPERKSKFFYGMCSCGASTPLRETLSEAKNDIENGVST